MKSSAKHSDAASSSTSSASGGHTNASRSQSKRQSAAAASHKSPQASGAATSNSSSSKTGGATKKSGSTVSPKAGSSSAPTMTTAGHASSHASANTQPPVNGGSGAGSTTAPTATKEKQSHYRNYAGFHTKSIRNIWEQHERHDMMDLAPDVLVRLAEDATYKQWELINHLKTYARHSGGHVTPALLNEVLRHSDADAILGTDGTAGPPAWHQLDSGDGSSAALHFPPDRVLDLRDEYLRDVQHTAQPSGGVGGGPLTLSCRTAVDPLAARSVARFSRALCVALLSGTHITCDYALHTAAIQPMVAVQLDTLFAFCTRVLCTADCTAVTLARVVAFLGAIARNRSVRQAAAHSTHDATLWWHLVQLLVCAALGPVDLNAAVPLAQQQRRRQRQRQQQQLQLRDEMTIKVETCADGVVVELDAGEQTRATTAMIASVAAVAMECDDGRDDEIPPECEALLQMMESDDFAGIVKEETEEGGETMVVRVKEEPPSEEEPTAETLGADVVLEEDDNGNGIELMNEDCDRATGRAEKFSKWTTPRCSDAQVEPLLRVMAELAAIWGYVETEMIYVMAKRLEVYFAELESDVYATIDYTWLSRCVRLLWSLGDFAFRELIVHLPEIDPDAVPESTRVHFNPCAMYLRGRSDIFLYEYLHELCGDGLLPFLCYYSKYNQKHALRRRRRWSADRNRALRIPVKLLLQRYTRLMRTASRTTATHADLFPDAVGAVVERRRPSSRSTATPSATIRFAFAGSAPVAPKVTRSDSNVASCMPATFAGAALLNQAQIVCRRRLLRSYTQPQFHRFSVIDYHRMPL